MKRLIVAIMLLASPMGIGALAVEPDEVLNDPGLEERAREISKDLRCLVCQNQSIDDSNAGLAKDLRILVRERLFVGDSDDQVKAFVVDRYGDFVLLRPPFNGTTFILWSGPFLIFVIALFTGVGMVLNMKRRMAQAADKQKNSTGEA